MQRKNKTFSSAVTVHKHKVFSIASSGKSGLFPGVVADSRGCTAASTSRAAAPSHSCSADVPSARLHNCHPVQQSEWKSWLNSSSRLDQSRAFPPASHRYLIEWGQHHHTLPGTWWGTVLMGTSCCTSFSTGIRSSGWLLPSSPFPRAGQKGWLSAHSTTQTCTPTAHTVPVLFGCHQHKT